MYFTRTQALYILHLGSWDCLCSCFACLFFFAFPRVNIFWKGMKIWQSLFSVCVQNKVVGNVLHHRGILPGYSKWSRNPSLLEVSEKWTKLAITCPINFTALVLFKHQNEDVIFRRKVTRSSLGETLYRLSVFGFPLLEWVGGGEGRGEGWRRLFGVLSHHGTSDQKKWVLFLILYQTWKQWNPKE